jgi:tetratricopeptide (TPR) repeat protein
MLTDYSFAEVYALSNEQSLQQNSVISKIKINEFNSAQNDVNEFQWVYTNSVWTTRDSVITQIQKGETKDIDGFIERLQQDYCREKQVLNAIKTAANQYKNEINETVSVSFSKNITDANYANTNLLSQVICEIGDAYKKAGDLSKANECYKIILKDWPESTHAKWATMHLIISDINNDNLISANSNINTFIDGCGTEDISQPICEIADEYRFKGDGTKSQELYRTILDKWPNGSHAIWAKVHITVSDLINNDQSDPQVVLSQLTANFSESDILLSALNEAANEFQKKGKISQANALHQKIFSLNPNDARLLWNKVRYVISQIDSPEKAETLVKEINSSYASWINKDYAILEIAEKCHKEGAVDSYPKNVQTAFLLKATELLDNMEKQNIKDNILMASVFYVKGLYLQEAGQYEDAIKSYQQVSELYQAHKYADYSLVAIGDCFKLLVGQKRMTEQDAYLNIKMSYEKLIKYYPQSKYAFIAKEWLQQN